MPELITSGDQDDPDRRLRLPTQPPELIITAIPADLVKALRWVAPQATHQIAAKVRLDVTAYACPRGGDRDRLILRIVALTVGYFMDVLEHKTTPVGPVLDEIRQLAQAEAFDGHSLDALRAAHQVAGTVAREAIHKASREFNTRPTHVNAIVDAMLSYIALLLDQADTAHKSVSAASDRAVQTARRSLVRAVISGKNSATYTKHAITADWLMPNDVEVVRARLARAAAPGCVAALHPNVLCDVRGSQITLVSAPSFADEVAQQVSEDPAVVKVVRSGTVPLAQVSDAVRWTDRALLLFDSGVITDTGIIDCAEHHAELWLYADPALANHACDKILAPLMSFSPNYRVSLGETMILWLQGHGSAPVLAERLNKHGQTTRRHLRIIKSLFDDQLEDVEQTIVLSSALDVALPRWRQQIETREQRQNGRGPKP